MNFYQSIYDAFKYLLNLLPDSPFKFLQSYDTSPVGQWLSYINWFIPINDMLVILANWCACILVYYIVQLILRWVRAIE